MVSYKLFIFIVSLQIFYGECYGLLNLPIPIKKINETVRTTLNKTVSIAKNLPLVDETTSLANYTYTVLSGNGANSSGQVDCLGLGKTVATTLEWFFRSQPNGTNALDVQFFLSSRKQPERVRLLIDEQFGLEWTDFKIERQTVFIVHGFLSHGQETWIRNMERAFLEWVSARSPLFSWSFVIVFILSEICV